MLYLEDFLELIEPLPQELRDRFTELRTLDLEVQNASDKLKTREDRYFANASGMATEERHKEATIIKQEYRKMEDNADEKVRIATGMHELVQRYERKLQAEINKFKLELEADNPGISEQLERKVRESEITHRNIRKERRRKIKLLETMNQQQSSGDLDSDSLADIVNDELGRPSSSVDGIQDSGRKRERITLTLSSPMRGSSAESLLKRRSAQDLPSLATSDTSSIYSSPTNQHSTLTSSLSASGGEMRSPTGSMGPPITPHSAVLPSFTTAHESRHGRPRKFTSRVQEMVKASMAKRESEREKAARVWSASSGGAGPSSANASSSSLLDTSGFLGAPSSVGGGSSEKQKRRRQSQFTMLSAATESGDDSDDEDEETKRKWCICQQPSYGNMVACDSGECPFEWFHYDCVGVTQPPRGKWFCPHCVQNMKRRRHNNESITSLDMET